jgi:hypothetical protein
VLEEQLKVACGITGFPEAQFENRRVSSLNRALLVGVMEVLPVRIQNVHVAL